MIPNSPQPTAGPANVARGGGTGWQNPIPISPPPGVAQCDKLMDEQDRRDRIELARKLGKG